MIHSLNNFKNFIILQNLIIFINIIIKKIILNFNKIFRLEFTSINEGEIYFVIGI